MASEPPEERVDLVPLQEPRPLTADEQSLLDFLLTGPLGSPELVAQAESAVVESTCSCGCRSVGLAVHPDAPPAAFGDADAEVVRLTARRRGEMWPEVTLHVVDGRMVELEIWAGEYGVRPRIATSELEHDAS